MFINRDEYAWADMSIQFNDIVITGIVGVTYTDRLQKEAIYGGGSEPRAIAHGNASYEGTLRVLQSEAQRMAAAAPNGSLLRLREGTITLSYERDGVLRTDQLTGVEFTEKTKGWDQGAPKMEVTLPFMFLRLRENI